MIFFSIIIPTYNSDTTIQACLKSILSQTLYNYEIVIVDGVSIDDTLNFTQKHKDNRIKVFSEKDNGIYDAMNKGIKHARGEWLYFLGSDDEFYDNDVLADIYKEITNKKNIGVLYGDVISTRFNGLRPGRTTASQILNKNICHQGIFIKKDVFGLIGNFNTDFKAQADWDHNLRWFMNGKIKKEYFNRTIARYADNGFSSVAGDDIFQRQKQWKYFLYGSAQLPF